MLYDFAFKTYVCFYSVQKTQSFLHMTTSSPSVKLLNQIFCSHLFT